MFYFFYRNLFFFPFCLTEHWNVPTGNTHTCIILVITRVRLKGKSLQGLLGDTVPAADLKLLWGVLPPRQGLPGIPSEEVASGMALPGARGSFKNGRVSAGCRGPHVSGQILTSSASFFQAVGSLSLCTFSRTRMKMEEELCLMTFLFLLWNNVSISEVTAPNTPLYH